MFLALLLMVLAPAAEEPRPKQSILVVVGAEGEPAYGEQFRSWAQRWQAAAKRGDADFTQIGLDDQQTTSDKDRLQKWLAGQTSTSVEPLWLILIGHGTFDRQSAKFNLRGPDVSAAELKDWCKNLRRPLVIVNCASSSGPFINALSGSGRVIVTATKSGDEFNFARFGDYCSQSITDERADLDKDGQTSLLEAFVSASAQVQQYYDQEARLASEHALIDDNGDGLGTPANWYRGVRSTRKAEEGKLPDGLLANQLCVLRSAEEAKIPPEMRARRDALELELARLREQKSSLDEAEYYKQVETIALQLARLYDGLEP